MDPNESAAGVAPSKDAINQAFQQWQAGQQQPAIDLIRPYADKGDLWALALITWFLHQTGDPGWRAAIPYAERAIRAGYPAAINYVLGNMQGDPALRGQAAELTALAIARGFPMDPMGYAQNAATQGDGESALKFLAAVGPYPASPDGWDDLVAHASQATERIDQSEQASNAGKQTIQRLESELEEEVRSATSRIKTQTGQLFALIEAATNRQSEAIFDEEAKTLKAEESGLWKAGMAVVAEPPRSVRRLFSLRLQRLLGPGGERSERARLRPA